MFKSRTWDIHELGILYDTTDNKKQILAGAVGVFAPIVLDFFLKKNIVFVSATVRPILLVEKN